MSDDSSDPQHHQQQLEQLKHETAEASTETGNDKPFSDQGLDDKLVQKIRSSIDLGKLTSTDIDNRVCEQLRTFPDDQTSIDSLFEEFDNSDLTGVVNKSAFLCNLIKQWRLKHPQPQKSSDSDPQTEQGFGDLLSDGSDKHKPGPDESKLKQILDRTGYKIEVTAGQRKYGGPPPDGPEHPAPNSEVFIGKLPREIFEDELILLCEEAGKIWDLRLMIDPASGFNKGYCFVTYCSHQDSAKACERLNGFAIRPGKIIKANGSVANIRLFIGNIPKTKSKDEIREELVKVVEGVMNVIVYTPADEADKKNNRGFCFVDFDTHKNASVARRKLGSGRVRVFNRDIAVDWADPDEEPDDTAMSEVKVLYVRNLTSDVAENDVKDLFLPYGNIERVRKVRDYAFVHFDKREDALNAMRALNTKVLGRNPMEISLAKPMSDKRKQAQMKREQRKQFDPTMNARPDVPVGPAASGFGQKPQRRGAMNRPPDAFHTNKFGGFGGEHPMGGAPRGVAMNRGPRGGGGFSGYRGAPRGGGGFSGDRGGHFGYRGGNNQYNQNNRGNFNNYRGGYEGPPYNNNNSGGYYNQGNQMSGGYHNGPNHQGNFGAFDGSQQSNQHGSFGRPPHQMNSGYNNFSMNSMPPANQQFGGMKRPSNPMNDGNMPKRARPDTGSWGAMGGDGNNGAQQQQHAGGNWYQDQGYSSSQQQSNYSWN